jgi:arsenate reductase (thioredoxin)
MKSILFICHHGSAKSLIAASYLNRVAEERGLQLSASCAGTEPDAAVPPKVVTSLANEGIDVAGFTPRQVTPELLRDASLIVTLGCDLGAIGGDALHVEDWNDLPFVSDGYERARDAIVERVDQLIERL